MRAPRDARERRAPGEPRARRRAAGRVPLRWLEFDASQAERREGLIESIYAGRVHGALVRGVFRPEEMARVAEGVGSGAFDGLRDRTPTEGRSGVQAVTYGVILTPTPRRPGGPELGAYLDRAGRLAALWARVFPSGPDIRGRLRGVLGALAGGRPAEVPAERDGRGYAPFTVRRLPPGAEVVCHVDAYRDIPAYRSLRGWTAPETQLSFFSPVLGHGPGGELIVRPGSRPSGSRGAGAKPPGEGDSGAVRIRPGVGDLVLFDGGRLPHAIAAPKGRLPRTTLGGFCALSADRSRLLFWS